MQRLRLVLASLLLSSIIAACDEADKVENKITCNDVCNRYKDCFDSNYDTGACTDSCEAEANSSEDKDRRLEQCNSCIDDQSCAASAFNCATQCTGIIVI